MLDEVEMIQIMRVFVHQVTLQIASNIFISFQRLKTEKVDF